MRGPSIGIVQTDPVAEELRPKYLSPSSISTFQQCPLRFKYSRIDKIKEPSTEAQIGGSMAHEVLELLMQRPAVERTIATARQILLDVWDSTWNEQALELGFSDYDRHMFRFRVWNYIENYFALEDPSTVELAGIECRLEGTIDDVPVLGILDRWEHADDGSAVISDYKTGKVSKKPYDAEKRQQLMVYVALHESLYDSTVSRAELIYLKNKGTRVAYEPTTEARAEMRAAVTSVWADMHNSCTTGEFETRKTRLCDWCFYKTTCPAWRK